MKLPKFIRRLWDKVPRPTRREPTCVQEVRWPHSPYFARVIAEIGFGKGYWSYLEVGVFENRDGEEILLGTYTRNYPSLMNTFFPFEKDGKIYALYAKDYTSTRVMSLPSCKDLGGEKRDTWGFCPADFYVPQPCEIDDDERISINHWDCDESGEYVPNKELVSRLGTFGFIAGCVWGDDCSLKIQYLDLREVEKGIIKRDDRFGYIGMSRGNEKLKDTISSVYISSDECVQIDIRPVITYRVWNDGTIRVFGKDDIAKDTRNRYDRKVGEKLRFFLIDVGEGRYKGGYPGQKDVDLRLEYLNNHPDFQPQGVIEVEAEATQEGYLVNGKEIKDSILFGIKDAGPYKGRTWMAEDDTYDLHDAGYWGL